MFVDNWEFICWSTTQLFSGELKLIDGANVDMYTHINLSVAAVRGHV